MQILPLDAKIAWEIEEYICKNHKDYVGVSVSRATPGHKFTAMLVNKEYNANFDEFDVLATMRYMVEMEILVSVGFFGSIETYSVAQNCREAQMAKWTYDRLASEIDEIQFSYIGDEISHPTKVAMEEEVFAAAGWTEDEYMTEMERRLDRLYRPEAK